MEAMLSVSAYAALNMAEYERRFLAVSRGRGLSIGQEMCIWRTGDELEERADSSPASHRT